MENWPEDRLDELEQLQKLLRDVESLDNRNNFLGNAANCIEAARKLVNGDREMKRISFLRFLEDQAYTR